MRTLSTVFLAWILTSFFAFAQSGNTTAGLAGIGAGAALGASSGSGSTTSSTGGGSAPMEVQVMDLYGLDQIAKDIAGRAADTVCKDSSNCPILIEDTVSSDQLALYRSAEAYFQRLSALNAQFQTALPITVLALPGSFPAATGSNNPQSISLKNLSGNTLAIKDMQINVIGNVDTAFTAKTDPSSCSAIAPRAICYLVVSFNPPATVQDGRSYSATIAVSYVGASSSFEQITFPVGGTAPKTTTPPQTAATTAPTLTVPPVSLTPEEKTKIIQNGKLNLESLKPEHLREMDESTHKLMQQDVQRGVVSYDFFGPQGSGEAPPPPASGTGSGSGTNTGSTSSSSPSPPATPYNLQWTNGLSTDAGTFKSGMTYTSASASPTNQAFAALVEKELANNKSAKIHPYTSSSPLNLKSAAEYMSKEFGQMLVIGSDVTAWTNECNKSTVGPAAPQSTSASYSACNNPDVVANLAIASQLTTSYSTLLALASDGNGNPVIVDVLRGRALTDLAGDQVPSLQLAVIGAGGSTKTNSYFGVSLFYQFAPSYNAGVLAAFELRDGQDHFVDSGVRNLLYGYKKWDPGHMSKEDHHNVDTHQLDCGFCSSAHSSSKKSTSVP
jgi:hypothetical protein